MIGGVVVVVRVKNSSPSSVAKQNLVAVGKIGMWVRRRSPPKISATAAQLLKVPGGYRKCGWSFENV